VSTAAARSGRPRRLLSRLHRPDFEQRRCVKSVKIEEEEAVSVEEIKGVLMQQEMKFDQGFTCFVTKCPRLVQSNKRAKLATDSDGLYINLTTGIASFLFFLYSDHYGLYSHR
jgi:hypothetical protein